MALVNSNFRESTLHKAWYDKTFRSTYALEFAQQNFGEVVERYDKGLGFTSFLHLAGKTMPVKNNSITIFEKGAPIRPVKVTIAIDAAPVNATTVTADVTDGSNAYLRAGDTIIIPASYTDQTTNQVMRISGSAGAWKGTFNNVSASITSALTNVIVAVGGTEFAEGSAGIDPRASSLYSRTTNYQIFKAAKGWEGGTIFNEQWDVIKMKDGTQGLYTRGIAELDFELDDQLDSALLTGQVITNTAGLTETSVSGNTNAIPAFDGLDQIMASLSQEQTWDATGYGLEKFKEIKVLLENVGVLGRDVDFFVGTDLNASIESELQDYQNQNAGGTKYWDGISKVGFKVNAITANSVTFNVAELTGLSNPQKFGLSAYNYRKQGFLFTQGMYMAKTNGIQGDGIELRLPHLTLGYPDNNGERRDRIFKLEPGVNGIAGMPNVAVNSYDGVKMHALMHVVPIWNHMYKAIAVNYNAAAGGGL